MRKLGTAVQPKWLRAGAAIALLVFLTLGVALSLTKPPFGDEGYCAAPGYTLITRGYMGLPASMEFGLQRHVYSQPPLYFLNQAVWIAVGGLSVFMARFSSILWGLVLLVSCYFALRKATGAREPAFLAAAVLSADYTFLMGATTARADMMASALGAAAVAVFLCWRERRFAWAVVASHTLMALSGLTHPAGGIVWEAALIAVTLGTDARRAVRPRLLALAIVPYLIGAAGWGIYILQDPASFQAQFLNITLSMDRGRALHSPFSTLLREVTERYWRYYGPTPNAPRVGALRSLLPLGYLGGLVCAFAVPSLRARPVVRNTAALFCLMAFVLAMVDGTKQLPYLLHLIPVAVALLALVLWYSRASWIVVAALVVIQLGPVLYRVRIDTYARDYLPAVEIVRPYAESGRKIIAGEQFGFPFRFSANIQSDVNYGYRTGYQPDLIEIETSVFDGNLPALAAHDPAEGAYLRKLLTEDFRQIWEGGPYRIYARAGAAR